MVAGGGLAAGFDQLTTGHVNPQDVLIGTLAGGAGGATGGRARVRGARPEQVQPPVEKAPYTNNNPRATPDELRIGALLQRTLPQDVSGAPEVVGARSGDYRLTYPDGTVTSADLYQPRSGSTNNILSHIMDKSGQAKIVIVEFGAGQSASLGSTEAEAIAADLFSTPGHSIERVIFIKGDTIIFDSK
jgi:hypothetical protein